VRATFINDASLVFQIFVDYLIYLFCWQLRALACSVACYLAVHEPSLRASLALLASPPAPLTAATTTDTTNRRRSSSSNSKSSGNATSDGWSLPMLLPGGCLVSISHLLWSPDAHVGACAATLLAAAVSDSAHRAQVIKG
jgi:hypothetical protein